MTVRSFDVETTRGYIRGYRGIPRDDLVIITTSGLVRIPLSYSSSYVSRVMAELRDQLHQHGH